MKAISTKKGDSLTIKNLKRLLPKKSLKYYMDNDTIESFHPAGRNNEIRHDIYNAANIMVSERYEKGDLVILVNALLVLLHETKS